MQVLKIVAEGMMTSFRYPHFMQQIHPSFHMPPPTTIYGHICSAMGEWVEPQGLEFAYHFTHQGTVKDLEHIIVLGASSGKLAGTTYPKVLEGSINPFQRELLFQPRLTLYLNRPEWVDNFRSPRYAVVLGRSQDLFTYTQVEVVELAQSSQAYFEHTLAPHAMALQFMQGITVLMPRFLDNYQQRAPSFERYLIVKDKVWPKDNGLYWVDLTSPEYKGSHLGLFFHGFGEVNHAAMA